MASSSSSMLDSKLVFVTRLISAGIPTDVVDRLIAGKIDTLGRLAYGSAAQPFTGDDTPFVAMICAKLRQTEDEIRSDGMGDLRRIWAESHTVAVAEIKHKVEATGESQPRKLPIPERAARLDAQMGRLAGVCINSRLEPSYSLCDAVEQMKQDEQLRYVSPESCNSRESELQGVRKEKFEADETKADVSNEFRARLALQRRSLALDQSELMRYIESESYHNFLYDLILQPVPASHFPISLHQVLQADKFLWGRMSEYCRKGISRRADGSRPMEIAMGKARLDPVVIAMLQPLPKPAGGRGGGQQESDGKGKGKGKEQKRKFESVSDGGKKGKGRGKDKGPFIAMPKALIGMNARTKDNKRICFAYNISGCDGGSECSKGAHVCCKCLGSHSQQNCSR